MRIPFGDLMKLRFWEFAVIAESQMKVESRRHAELLSFLALIPTTIQRTFTKAKPPVLGPEDFDPLSAKKRKLEKKIQSRDDLYRLGVQLTGK